MQKVSLIEDSFKSRLHTTVDTPLDQTINFKPSYTEVDTRRIFMMIVMVAFSQHKKIYR